MYQQAAIVSCLFCNYRKASATASYQEQRMPMDSNASTQVANPTECDEGAGGASVGCGRNTIHAPDLAAGALA